MGLNPGSPKGLPDPSWFRFSPSLLHTWKKPRIFQETPGFSEQLQDFPGIPAFQPGFGEKAGKQGISTTFLAPFFGKLQQDLSSAPESLSHGNSHFIPA